MHRKHYPCKGKLSNMYAGQVLKMHEKADFFVYVRLAGEKKQTGRPTFTSCHLIHLDQMFDQAEERERSITAKKENKKI